MNKKLTQNGWKQKLIRIREQYDRLTTFLIYIGRKTIEDERLIFDDICIKSLDFLYMDGFHYKFLDFDGRREPKGFLLENSTFEKLQENFKLYSSINNQINNDKLTIGQFMELLLYIYCQNFLDGYDKEYINRNTEWGIIDIKNK